MMPWVGTQKLPTMWRKMGLNADERHRGDSRMVVGSRRNPPHLHIYHFSSELFLHLYSFLAVSVVSLGREALEFFKSNPKKIVILLKKKKTGKRENWNEERQTEREGE